MAATWWLALFVGVVAIVAGIAAWTFLRDDVTLATGDTTTTEATHTTSDGATTTEGETTTTSVDTTTAPTATTAGDGSTTIAPFGTATADEAVLAWIGALAAGDLDTAWALMDETAREAIGGREVLEALRTDLAEGFGAWGDAADRFEYVSVVERAFQTEIEVVTLVGEITQDGRAAESVTAVPAIRRSDLGFQALPFARSDDVVFVSPPPLDPNDPAATPPIAVGGTIFVEVPGTTSLVVMSVDGDFVVMLESEDLVPGGEGTARATAAIDPPIDAGRHALTVVYLDDDVVHADAILFEAVG